MSLARNTLPRLLAALMTGAVLAGCSTVSDVRSNPPLLDIRTQAPAKVVAECVRDGWQNLTLLGFPLGGELQSTGDHYSVLASDAEQPAYLVDVVPTAEGSRVTYHFFHQWTSPPDRVGRVVQSCATSAPAP